MHAFNCLTPSTSDQVIQARRLCTTCKAYMCYANLERRAAAKSSVYHKRSSVCLAGTDPDQHKAGLPHLRHTPWSCRDSSLAANMRRLGHLQRGSAHSSAAAMCATGHGMPQSRVSTPVALAGPPAKLLGGARFWCGRAPCTYVLHQASSVCCPRSAAWAPSAHARANIAHRSLQHRHPRLQPGRAAAAVMWSSPSVSSVLCMRSGMRGCVHRTARPACAPAPVGVGTAGQLVPRRAFAPSRGVPPKQPICVPPDNVGASFQHV